jgi:hypothetical protein
MMDVLRGMKLFVVGVLLLASALALTIFSDFNPAQLFIGGAVCTFLGVVSFLSPSYEPGPAVSAGDVSDARSLANIQHYGSPVRDANSVFDPGP